MAFVVLPAFYFKRNHFLIRSFDQKIDFSSFNAFFIFPTIICSNIAIFQPFIHIFHALFQLFKENRRDSVFRSLSCLIMPVF